MSFQKLHAILFVFQSDQYLCYAKLIDEVDEAFVGMPKFYSNVVMYYENTISSLF